MISHHPVIIIAQLQSALTNHIGQDNIEKAASQLNGSHSIIHGTSHNHLKVLTFDQLQLPIPIFLLQQLQHGTKNLPTPLMIE